MRGALCNYAEDIRRRTASLFSWSAGWRYPIAIAMRDQNAHTREKTQSQLRLIPLRPDIMLQLDVALGRDFDPARIRAQLIAALLMERAAARSPVQIRETFDLPAWLVEGTCGLMDLRAGTESTPGLAALLQQNSIPDLRHFLKQDPRHFDSASSRLYRGFSACLLKLLIELPDGARALDSYLASIPTGKVNSLRALLAFFPALGGSEAAAQKWWKLGVAALATRGKRSFLAPEETLRELDRLLSNIKIELPKKKRAAKNRGETSQPEPAPDNIYALSEYAAFIKNKNRKAPLEALMASLNSLSARSHPLLQAVVSSYNNVVAKLIKGETKGLDADLEKLVAIRAQALKRCTDIEDYMNWYEATSINFRSGAFDGYFRALEELQRGTPDQVKSPFAIYLERIQLELP